MSNVVSLKALRELKAAGGAEYRTKVLGMDKLSLLEEMVRFQEERSCSPCLTPDMIGRGLVLFSALQKTSESDELRHMTRTYRKHLEKERAVLMGNYKPTPKYVRSPSRAVLKRVQ
jgi:hypothetical protein